jgi:hypothetical protein
LAAAGPLALSGSSKNRQDFNGFPAPFVSKRSLSYYDALCRIESGETNGLA